MMRNSSDEEFLIYTLILEKQLLTGVEEWFFPGGVGGG